MPGARPVRPNVPVSVVSVFTIGLSSDTVTPTDASLSPALFVTEPVSAPVVPFSSMFSSAAFAAATVSSMLFVCGTQPSPEIVSV